MGRTFPTGVAAPISLEDLGMIGRVRPSVDLAHPQVSSIALRLMRGLTQLRCARVITTGHAFIQNLRRGHYELGTEETTTPRVMAAFTELTLAI